MSSMSFSDKSGKAFRNPAPLAVVVALLAWSSAGLSAHAQEASARQAAPAPTQAASAPNTPVTTQGATQDAASPASAPEPYVLQPFIASYTVQRSGERFGQASLRLQRKDDARWLVNLGIHATEGLFGLAGLDAQQSTLFYVSGRQYLPLSQRTVRQALFFDQTSTGMFDWNADLARWSGDISDHRKRPVPLQTGDMSSLLINLAVIRDAQPGATLEYRVVDNGRARPHRYEVAAEKESITVNDIRYRALRAQRVDDPGETTVFWVAEGVPTPIRILKREDGEEVYDLHLIEYRGT